MNLISLFKTPRSAARGAVRSESLNDWKLRRLFGDPGSIPEAGVLLTSFFGERRGKPVTQVTVAFSGPVTASYPRTS